MGKNEYIGVQRTKEGYNIVDKRTRICMAKLYISTLADDTDNTKLRDAVVNAYYQYGKALEMYK